MQRRNETVTGTASCASIVDPDEGTTLEFISVPVFNGVKFAKVDVKDIEEGITYWHNAIICYVLGASLPSPALGVLSNGFGGIM